METSQLRIVFFGTTDFAVASLDILIRNNYKVIGVVTIPDKPAGRGQKLHSSPVKDFAVEHNLFLLQPVNLKSPDFIEELNKLKADLQIIIAFRILPEIVWSMPPLGTFNLHASLLPQYRGAAPINRAVMNGEKETGLTTFFLNNNIDTGKIILQERIEISESETAGELSNRMKIQGAELVIKTIKLIEENIHGAIEQSVLIDKSIVLKPAPKILKDDCRINWNDSAENIYNFIRGLSPVPCAFTEFISPDNNIWYFKIYSSVKKYESSGTPAGTVLTDSKTFLGVSCNNGIILIKEIQLRGKKRLLIDEFLRGFKINDAWKVCL